MRFDDVGAILEEVEQELNFLLPPHESCVAHTLNLIATNEVDKVASQGPSQKLCRSAMSKCSSIWNKVHRSTIASKATEDIASMKVNISCVKVELRLSCHLQTHSPHRSMKTWLWAANYIAVSMENTHSENVDDGAQNESEDNVFVFGGATARPVALLFFNIIFFISPLFNQVGKVENKFSFTTATCPR